MRRFVLLLVVVGLLAFGFVYLRRNGSQGMPEVPALGDVKEKLGQVGDKLRETKTTGSVKAALELRRELQPYSFNVDSATDGAVTLKGEVPSEDLKRLAGQVAGAVPDVARIDNQVRVNPQAVAPPPGNDRTVGENLDDKTLEAKVSLAFSLNRDLKGTDIKVSAFKRTVTLTGQAASEAQRQLAVGIARETTGVAAVTDQIGVSGASAPAAGEPAVKAAAAQAALRANGSLAPYALSAGEESGRLVLHGQVKTSAEKDLAGLVARDAAGGPVENQISVSLGTH
jgi:osmotically-inducible protein OsmY